MTLSNARMFRRVCTCCGQHGPLYESERFPTVRLCFACIRKAHITLYELLGDVPPFVWLVAPGMIGWVTGLNNFTNLPAWMQREYMNDG